MAGSNSSPCAGQKNSRPMLRVNISLTHSQVSDIWNSHVESLCTLMTNGPQETRWIALSPATNSSGEQLFTRTTREALTRIVGDDVTLVFAQTPDASPSESLMGMMVDEEQSVAGYVFGMGGMGGDIAPENYQFGLSTPSEHASSPVAQHIEFSDTAMDVDLVHAFVFGQNGMGLDFATLSDQMADHHNGDYVVQMAQTRSSAARQNQGAPTATTQPSATSTAIQPSASSQNQVSSSMPPPPRPTTTTAATGVLIQPYGLPANAPPADPNASAYATLVLANSGVSVLTDYPLSTSPRMSTRDANRILDAQGDGWWYSTTHPMQSGDALGQRHNNPPRVVKPRANFQPFSWDSTSQPRTEAARRAEGSDDNLSPGSSEKSNKRKHSQLSKE